MIFFFIVSIFFVIIYVIALVLFFTGLFRPVLPNSNKTPIVSIIIAVKNEMENLPEILSLLTLQNYPTNLHEIIIIDNGSTDGSYQFLLEHQKRITNLQCFSTNDFKSEYKYKKAALDLGIQKSKGDLILSTDADCRMGENWIKGIVKYFCDDVDMVIGFSGVSYNKSIFQKLQSFDFLMLMAAAQGSLNNGFSWGCSGQNIAFRKQAFYHAGGYESVKKLKGGDDVLFLLNFTKMNNGKIVFASHSDSWIRNKPEKSYTDFIRQRMRWASEASFSRHISLTLYIVSIATLITNFSLLFFLIVSFFIPTMWKLFFIIFLLKIVWEGALSYKATKVYNQKSLLKIFPIWFIFDSPYVVVMSILSIFGNRIKWR